MIREKENKHIIGHLHLYITILSSSHTAHYSPLRNTHTYVQVRVQLGDIFQWKTAPFTLESIFQQSSGKREEWKKESQVTMRGRTKILGVQGQLDVFPPPTL